MSLAFYAIMGAAVYVAFILTAGWLMHENERRESRPPRRFPLRGERPPVGPMARPPSQNTVLGITDCPKTLGTHE